jgi:hypothetical protein
MPIIQPENNNSRDRKEELKKIIEEIKISTKETFSVAGKKAAEFYEQEKIRSAETLKKIGALSTEASTQFAKNARTLAETSTKHFNSVKVDMLRISNNSMETTRKLIANAGNHIQDIKRQTEPLVRNSIQNTTAFVRTSTDNLKIRSNEFTKNMNALGVRTMGSIKNISDQTKLQVREFGNTTRRLGNHLQGHLVTLQDKYTPILQRTYRQTSDYVRSSMQSINRTVRPMAATLGRESVAAMKRTGDFMAKSGSNFMNFVQKSLDRRREMAANRDDRLPPLLSESGPISVSIDSLGKKMDDSSKILNSIDSTMKTYSHDMLESIKVDPLTLAEQRRKDAMERFRSGLNIDGRYIDPSKNQSEQFNRNVSRFRMIATMIGRFLLRFGLIFGALHLIGTQITKSIDTFENQGFFAGISEVFSNMFDGITSLMDRFKAFVGRVFGAGGATEVTEVLDSFSFADIGVYVKEIGRDVMTWIQTAFTKVSAGFGSLSIFLIEGLGRGLDFFFSGITKALDWMKNAISGLLRWLGLDVISNYLESLQFHSFYEKIRDTVVTAWRWIKSLFGFDEEEADGQLTDEQRQGFWPYIKGAVTGAFNWIVRIFRFNGTDADGNVDPEIRLGFWPYLREKVRDAVTWVVNLFKIPEDKDCGWLCQMFGEMGEFLMDKLAELWTLIKCALNIENFTILETMGDFISSTIAGIWGAIKSVFNFFCDTTPDETVCEYTKRVVNDLLSSSILYIMAPLNILAAGFPQIGGPLRFAANLLQNILTTVGNIVSIIGHMMKNFFFIGRLVGGALDILGAIIRSVGRFLLPLNIVLVLFDTIKGALDGYAEDGLSGLASGALKGAINGLIGIPLNFLKNVVAWILDMVGLEAIAQYMREEVDFTRFFSSIIDNFASIGSYIGNAIADIFVDGNILRGLREIFTGLVFGIPDLLRSLIASIAGLFGLDRVEEWLRSFSLVESINDFMDSPIKFIRRAMDYIIGLFNSAVDGIGNLFGRATNFVEDAWKRIIRSILPSKGDEATTIEKLLGFAIPDNVYRYVGLNPQTGEEYTSRELAEQEVQESREEIESRRLGIQRQLENMDAEILRKQDRADQGGWRGPSQTERNQLLYEIGFDRQRRGEMSSDLTSVYAEQRALEARIAQRAEELEMQRRSIITPIPPMSSNLHSLSEQNAMAHATSSVVIVNNVPQTTNVVGGGGGGSSGALPRPAGDTSLFIPQPSNAFHAYQSLAHMRPLTN